MFFFSEIRKSIILQLLELKSYSVFLDHLKMVEIESQKI